MTSNVHVRLSGEYRFEVRREGAVVESTGWCKNLITNIGLDMIGSNAAGTTSYDMMSFCHIGTGTATPANTDTALGAFVAAASRSGNTPNNTGSPTYKATQTCTYVFAQGAAVGNMAEVGVGRTNTTGNLFSRARIVNASNNPTTLTLTAIDQLTVYYRVVITPVLTDISGSVTISGISYNYVGRLSNAASYFSGGSSFLNSSSALFITSANAYPSTSTLGAITGTPTGSPSSITSAATKAPYTSGNYYHDCTLNATISEGNASGGIACMQLTYGFSGGAIYQYSWSPVIPKDNTKVLALPFRFSWSR